jgi:lytic cellulose monooxygenase (C4-dehydrogenating)
VIDASHKGPLISYLYAHASLSRPRNINSRNLSAKVPDATQEDVTGLEWFKIYEDGYDASTGVWAVDKLIENAGKVTFTIPECIEPGQYLLRHELIGKFLPSSQNDLFR